MKQGGQKRKGNNYEIEISRILSQWYLTNERLKSKKKEDIFWRTAGSGAKATRGKGTSTSFYGDITFLPAPEKLKVWIDCKNIKSLTFNNILSKSFLPLKWYNEEKKKQRDMKINKPILIIFKLHRKKENYIFFEIEDWDIILWKDALLINNKTIVIELKKFLDKINKEDIIKNGKKEERKKKTN